MKFIRLGIVVTALAALPASAHAGLMFGWQVSGTLYPFPNSPTPGQIVIPSSTGTVTASDSNFQATITTVSMTGWSEAVLKSGSYNQLTTPFNVAVTLTDGPSGQSGVINVGGVAWASQSPPELALGINGGIAGTQTNPASLTLGNNQYTAWITQAFSTPNSTAPIVASVEISVTALAAPEPTTLALIGSGFPLVGIFFRRQRANGRS